MKVETTKKSRLHRIDEYRGFVLLNMIAYHAIWDIVYIFGENWKWYKSDIGFYWQQWICWSFILVSGFCWQMGKHPLKRGLQVYAGGVIISLVTMIAMPGSRVMFGILTLLGSAMILMIPLDLLCRKMQPVLGGVVSFLLFLFTYPVNRGYLGIGANRFVELPAGWYVNGFTTYLGFEEADFYSTDYFSIVPWFFLFVTGYFLYSVVFQNTDKERVVMSFLQKSVCSWLGLIGRSSLIIYMLHQPVVYGLLFIIYR